MAAIRTGNIYGNGAAYDVLCFKCGAVVYEKASRSELSEMTAYLKESPLCFDCDGLFSDVVPDKLIPKWDELICICDENLILRSIVFWAPSYKNIVAKAVKFWQQRLSCYPYLPKLAPKSERNSEVTK